MSGELFVPEDFAVPDGLTAVEFRLEPLGPQHNEADYAAWMGSIDHIRATPGFPDGRWPREMSLADNLRDLERHARDFAGRRGFTYTVLSTGTGDVMGCVYIYPVSGHESGGAEGRRHASVQSWVRADCAALDPVLHDAVLAWVERDWPFDSIEYAPRTGQSSAAQIKAAQISAAQYDAMAADYAASNAEHAFNAYYERPAMIAMLGDVAGKRVLDAGCGSGALAAWLAEHGATVTAFDGSGEMAALARKRLGDAADIGVADLARPLTFAADQAFDLVVASLVLHYVLDWTAVFGEFRRVLAPGGAVVFSTHHPFMDWQLDGITDYFAMRQITETWRKGDGEYEVSFWRRPLSVMFEQIQDAGFTVDELAEPAPLPELEGISPADYRTLTTKPRFLFFRLRPR